MKRKFEIPKSRLYADKNYSQILKSRYFEGFSLIYKQLEPIQIPSGAVCFFDAYAQGGSAKPFMQKFDYTSAVPFSLGIETSTGERIAFAGLQFDEAEPEEWRLALFEERDVIKLTADNGYPVSVMIHSGLLGAADYLTQREYTAFTRGKEEAHPLESVVRFEGNTAVTYAFNEKNAIAVFSSGWGDGQYPAYIGLSGGKAVALIIDFLMIEPGKKEKVAGTEKFEFEIEIEQLYQNDPKLGPEENNVAKWSFVIGHKDEVDEFALCRAYARRGYAYHSLRNLPAALSDYYTAMELAERLEFTGAHKMREWTLYDNAGVINRAQGNVQEAKRLFEKGKKVGDNFYSGAYINLIEIYMSEKDYERATATAEEMVRMRPNDPMSYMKSAEVCVASGKYEKALKHYVTLIEKFRYDEAIMEKTACLGLLKKYDEALACLETYIVDNGPNEVYYHNKGFLKYKQKKVEEARENLLRAFEYNPGFAPALNLLIEIDELAFDYPNILKWATKYIEIRPDSEYGYSIRANAYKRLGEFSCALSDYEHIVENISQDPVYYKQLVLVSLLSRNYPKAKRYVKKLKSDSNGWYTLSCALILQKQHKPQKAERLFDACLADTQNEHFLSAAADFYIKIKNKEKAFDAVERLKDADLGSYIYIVRAFNYYRVFDSLPKAHEGLDEYLARNLSGVSEASMGAQIKSRIETVANIYLKNS